MNGSTLTTIIDGVLSVAIVGASTVLLALHDVNGMTAIALFTAAGFHIQGAAKTLLALKVPPGA